MAGGSRNRGRERAGVKVLREATQTLQTMMAINDLGIESTQRNLTFAADLEERLNESNLSRTLDVARATGKEERFNIAEQGVQSRANIVASGEQERKSIATTGEQQRLTQAQRYAGETGLIRTTGEESRKGIETTGTQQRLTDLQQEMFRRYKENRDYEQAQTAARQV